MLFIPHKPPHLLSPEMENANGHRGRKLDEINMTLQQLVADKKNNGNRRFLTKEEHQLIPHLLSQLEELQKDGNCESSGGGGNSDELPEEEDSNMSEEGDSKDEILEELDKMKKQSMFTQYLVTALIGVTIIWQMSELSMFLILRSNVTNPCRAIYGAIRDTVKKAQSNRGKNANDQDMFCGVGPLIKQLEIPAELSLIKETEGADASNATTTAAAANDKQNPNAKYDVVNN